MLRPLLTLLVLLGVTAPATAQLQITELFLDPVGPNGGLQIIEITNISGGPFTPPNDWSLCARPQYPPLPQVTIPTDGVVRVHIGAIGTDTPTDWFVPGIPLLFPDGEIAIYATNLLFHDPTLMIDFVSWGTGAASPFTSRMTEAVTAGLWPSPTAHVALPPEGSATVAWLGEGVGPQAWFIDTTPTLGAPNNPATFTAFGSGCAGGAGIPGLHAAAPGARPWLGAPFGLQVTNLVGPAGAAILVLSFTQTPPQSLVPVGLGASCQSYLTPDVLQFGFGGSAVTFTLGLPLSASLEGVTLLAQAVANDPTVATPVPFTVSNAARLVTGLK